MAEQQPPRSRRRVVLDPDTPVPLVWGDDERLGQPRIPRTAPVPPAGARTPGRARLRTPARTELVRPARGALAWVAAGLVLVAVVSLVGVVVSLVLLQRGMR